MAPGQIEKKGALGRELAQVRFGRLYRDQGRAILAYALRRVEDPKDAAEVVAETSSSPGGASMMGAAVTGTVSCLWFRQRGEARRAGDSASAAEAEKAMATARHWPILRKMAKDGAYPELVWDLAAAMPSGVWQRGPHRWAVPHAEGLGCARMGIPILPWKQRLQRKRRDLQSQRV